MILQTRLTRRYRIKAGVPTLILLEGSNGSVVTRGGVERTVADPAGAEFPWRPPHPKAALEDGPLLPCSGRDSNEPMLHEELRHCFKGVYFSAHWVSNDVERVYILIVSLSFLSCVSSAVLLGLYVSFSEHLEILI